MSDLFLKHFHLYAQFAGNDVSSICFGKGLGRSLLVGPSFGNSGGRGRRSLSCGSYSKSKRLKLLRGVAPHLSSVFPRLAGVPAVGAVARGAWASRSLSLKKIGKTEG
jgi:hypothetical protein